MTEAYDPFMPEGDDKEPHVIYRDTQQGTENRRFFFHNAMLELKTKSDCVDLILDAEHRGRTVVSWSLNTEYIINHEESGTASLQRRLDAMKKVHDSGYLLGLHFVDRQPCSPAVALKCPLGYGL